MKIGFNQPQSIQTTQAKNTPKFKGTVLSENDEYRVVMQKKRPKTNTAQKIANIALSVGTTVGIFGLLSFAQGKMNGVSKKAAKEALPKIFEALEMPNPQSFRKGIKTLKENNFAVLNKAINTKGIEEHVKPVLTYIGHTEGTKQSAIETGKFAAVWEGISAIVRNIIE